MTIHDVANTSIAIIFEVIPTKGQQQNYLSIAASLHPKLKDVDGFISIERFESLSQPGKILSLSFWRDETAVAAWRMQPDHQQAQLVGRGGVFEDYRIRVASIIRDYGLFERSEVPL